MIKRHNIVVILAAFFIAAGIWIFSVTKGVKKKTTISIGIFKGFYGWGYDILVNDSVFIHQESVPGMTGNNGFSKKEQAIQTAQLIINKMKRGQLPSVTTFELKQLFPLNEIQYGRQAHPQ